MRGVDGTPWRRALAGMPEDGEATDMVAGSVIWPRRLFCRDKMTAPLPTSRAPRPRSGAKPHH